MTVPQAKTRCSCWHNITPGWTGLSLRHTSYDDLPKIDVDPQACQVKADGVLLWGRRAGVLPMAQRYFLFQRAPLSSLARRRQRSRERPAGKPCCYSVLRWSLNPLYFLQQHGVKMAASPLIAPPAR
nr:hypothetical protein [Pseudomonas sp. NFR16]